MVNDVFFVEVKPDGVVLAAEPRQLPLGVVAGGLLEALGAVVEAGRALKVREKLLVADGLRGGAVAVAVVVDLARFVKNPVFHHQIDAAADAVIERRAVATGQAEAERAVGWLGSAGVHPLLAHFATGSFEQFQCADDAGQVVRVYLCRVVGVDSLQLGVKRRAALRLGLCL